MSFSCPLCHASLTHTENSFICPQGHTFDKAKEGYVNLLPVQHKRSRDPGDSAEMMPGATRIPRRRALPATEGCGCAVVSHRTQ